MPLGDSLDTRESDLVLNGLGDRRLVEPRDDVLDALAVVVVVLALDTLPKPPRSILNATRKEVHFE